MTGDISAIQDDDRAVLAINAGSSSLKIRLYAMAQEHLMFEGHAERIGEDDSRCVYRVYDTGGAVSEQIQSIATTDHASALQLLFAALNKRHAGSTMPVLSAIGHRVVHGGETFQEPTLIDDDVIDSLRALIPLAPLHNPANLATIETARRLYPRVMQVAVFDTAFFHTLPSYACRYAVPEALYREQHVRRYGFHGTSHQQAARQAADYLQQPLTSLRLITLHLGNGASAAAIRDGRCIDTSMGMTPLEGLIMGTRCGDLDPSVPLYLARTMGMSTDDIEDLLNHDSGMKGLCGATDMRDIHRLADRGDQQARLAIDMYCYRIAKYVGAYYIALGGVDALVFTGGVGENDARIRRAVCAQLSPLGIRVDEQANQAVSATPCDISKASSNAGVLIVTANEELEIARQALAMTR